MDDFTPEQKQQIESLPKKEEQTQADTTERITSAILVLKEMIPLVLSLSAVFAAGGFLIVNGYLSQFGAIQAYSILPGRYLSASLWLCAIFLVVFGYGMIASRILNAFSWGENIRIGLLGLFLLFVFASKLSDPTTWRMEFKAINILVFAHGLIAMYAIPSFYESSGAREANESDTENSLINQLTNMIIKVANIISTYVNLGSRTIAIIVTLIIVIGLFNDLIYKGLPQYLGGGKPLEAELILEKSDVSDLLPLSRVTGTQQTKPILILSELIDGLLVHDETLNTTMVIKDKYIGAIVGVTIPMSVSGTNP